MVGRVLERARSATPISRYRSGERPYGLETSYWLPVGVAVLMAVVLRFLIQGYNLYLMDLVLLAGMGAMALNLLTGIAGQVSLGNAALIGLGAFTAVVLTREHFPFVGVVAIATIVSAIIGAFIGLPALRVRGIYLLLSTLALQYIFVYAVQDYQAHSAGASGFTVPTATVLGWRLVDPGTWYGLECGVLIVLWILLRNLLRTKSGRAWMTISSNESVAGGLGLPVARYKIMAFVISSGILGLQGSLYAYFVGTVTASQWTLGLATSYVVMITIGGFGSLGGSVAGAAIVTLLPTWVGDVLSSAHGLPASIAENAGPVTSFIYGVIVISVIVIFPAGLAGAVGRSWKRLVSLWRAGG